jgi:hypothetical protein
MHFTRSANQGQQFLQFIVAKDNKCTNCETSEEKKAPTTSKFLIMSPVSEVQLKATGKKGYDNCILGP